MATTFRGAVTSVFPTHAIARDDIYLPANLIGPLRLLCGDIVEGKMVAHVGRTSWRAVALARAEVQSAPPSAAQPLDMDEDLQLALAMSLSEAESRGEAPPMLPPRAPPAPPSAPVPPPLPQRPSPPAAVPAAAQAGKAPQPRTLPVGAASPGSAGAAPANGSAPVLIDGVDVCRVADAGGGFSTVCLEEARRYFVERGHRTRCLVPRQWASPPTSAAGGAAGAAASERRSEIVRLLACGAVELAPDASEPHRIEGARLPPLVALAIECRAVLVTTAQHAGLAKRAFREAREQAAMEAWARAWVCPFAFSPTSREDEALPASAAPPPATARAALEALLPRSSYPASPFVHRSVCLAGAPAAARPRAPAGLAARAGGPARHRTGTGPAPDHAAPARHGDRHAGHRCQGAGESGAAGPIQ
jgi:hypothetical protein